MDALVTIAILDGKKQIGTIEKTIAIHDTVAAELNDNPANAAGWILNAARGQLNFQNTIIKKGGDGKKEN